MGHQGQITIQVSFSLIPPNGSLMDDSATLYTTGNGEFGVDFHSSWAGTHYLG